jgi:anti-anti-sigma factor
LDSQAQSPDFQAVVTGHGHVQVAISGELDVTTSESLIRLLAELADGRPISLSIDMSKVSFLDCASARLLIGASAFLPPGERPVLSSVQPAVRRLLELIGLDEAIETAETGE